MKETGNGVHVEDRNRKDYDGDRNRRVRDGYPNGWTDHETGSELRRGIPLSGCRGVSLRSHSGIASGHLNVITDLLHAKFHASAAFRRFVAGAYFPVIEEVFASHVSR